MDNQEGVGMDGSGTKEGKETRRGERNKDKMRLRLRLSERGQSGDSPRTESL